MREPGLPGGKQTPEEKAYCSNGEEAKTHDLVECDKKVCRSQPGQNASASRCKEGGETLGCPSNGLMARTPAISALNPSGDCLAAGREALLIGEMGPRSTALEA